MTHTVYLPTEEEIYAEAARLRSERPRNSHPNEDPPLFGLARQYKTSRTCLKCGKSFDHRSPKSAKRQCPTCWNNQEFVPDVSSVDRGSPLLPE